MAKIKKWVVHIVMDDVSGVVDIPKKCANFLTVSRKFGLCLKLKELEGRQRKKTLTIRKH